MFDFQYEEVGKDRDILAVVVTGTLDQSNCHYLLDCVREEILEGRKKLIVDCGRLNYVSSMGLATLVRIHSRMKRIGGDVKLAAVGGAVAQVFGVVGLNKLFQIYATVDEAVAAHGG